MSYTDSFSHSKIYIFFDSLSLEGQISEFDQELYGHLQLRKKRKGKGKGKSVPHVMNVVHG